MSSLPAFDFGDRVTLTATFRNASGVEADPTTVRWRLRPPTGAETLVTATGGAYTIENPTPGTHRLKFTPPTPGEWVARAEGLGAIEQAREVRFLVRPSQIRSASITP